MASSSNKRKGGQKGGARKAENNRIYAHPLPLVLSPPQPRTFNPHCEGVFDPATRSVWITNEKDSTILWRRGFFGKGDLSRSEPSWLARQVNARKAAGKYMTSEEVREKRRQERKQFKLDRAAALARAAAEAEAAFAEGREAAPTFIPSGATWKPQQQVSAEPSLPEEPPEEDDETEQGLELLEDREHLQLTLQEAFFLAWNLDCLTILNSHTWEPMSLKHIWATFQDAHCVPHGPPTYDNRFDNPFLVNYAAYHYYRSLGWVIKGGIKFCVDLLLYKRGPVFHHAESSVQSLHPPELHTFSWSWLSTVNRVNSQVMKTLILTYVTIPAQSRISTELLSSPACLAHYSVRDVVLRRFIPARMRD
ncbi:uncharacterized protein BXZ73DRAFT_88603 [Epithele typhae]|uniref:uncharacterized protein n=1 Tax=Epithele typhae TaxID=378194 RepID=UPI0020076B8F|nr:uncharacterized protein BXZ73DRAFT_88603 [Epithele typhae]KAH9940930.1 hypothetical protein BXZ73DRAFT_88603 [Epithele typhae]